MYRLVGRIGEPRDYRGVSSGRESSTRRHAGVEFVLVTGADRFQVQADGWARDWTVGSRVAATGRLAVVSEYEWDGFELDESRADWLVNAVTPADDDDFMLDLAVH
ncbi:MAG TPA: hypothetical protein VME46_19610 [Acidimicrobiales bacterium]|nr:hypothetical protein [Acidimicrobiales bacterium]